MRRLAIAALAALTISGCGDDGGGPASSPTPTPTVTEEQRLDAFMTVAGAAADIAGYCYEKQLSGSGQELTRGDVSKRVGEAIAAYQRSGADPEARDALAEAAASLRDCGEDSLAERLERAADG